MANKWLEALKSKNTPHNTEEDCAGEGVATLKNLPTPENPPDKIDRITNGSKVGTSEPSKNGHPPKKALDKVDKNTRKAKKKKLTPEEEAAEVSRLAETYPSYVVTEERAREVLEWARRVPEVAIDIETHGRLKRDGLLYTRCQVRMILLASAAGGESWFLDCDHVPESTIVEIL
jgi:hypothetical protein